MVIKSVLCTIYTVIRRKWNHQCKVFQKYHTRKYFSYINISSQTYAGFFLTTSLIPSFLQSGKWVFFFFLCVCMCYVCVFACMCQENKRKCFCPFCVIRYWLLLNLKYAFFYLSLVSSKKSTWLNSYAKRTIKTMIILSLAILQSPKLKLLR